MINRYFGFIVLILFLAGALLCVPDSGAQEAQTFAVKGVLQKLDLSNKTATIKHEEIPGYMEAMTMPFHLLTTNEWNEISQGDTLDFQLSVTGEKSWISHVRKSKTSLANLTNSPPEISKPTKPVPREFVFTNELGRRVTLGEFKGQALALTFFFTRCPIPDYCPRLSKNFAEASSKLAAMKEGPTNYHFLSISFDPDRDTPEVLFKYGKLYNYHSEHWSFLTGTKEMTDALGAMFDFHFTADAALYNHDFRTVIISAAGKVQMIYPMGGNLSDNLAEEMIKAMNPEAAK